MRIDSLQYWMVQLDQCGSLCAHSLEQNQLTIFQSICLSFSSHTLFFFVCYRSFSERRSYKLFIVSSYTSNWCLIQPTKSFNKWNYYFLIIHVGDNAIENNWGSTTFFHSSGKVKVQNQRTFCTEAIPYDPEKWDFWRFFFHFASLRTKKLRKWSKTNLSGRT